MSAFAPAAPAIGGDFRNALRFALREIRGGVRGFGVFLACLALGVVAIAGVGSFAAALSDGLAREGGTILGGDAAFSLANREASATERSFLEDRGTVSAVATMRAMARGGEATALVAVMLRSTVEQYERHLEEIGARPGMVSLCTPNLFNLCRGALTNGATAGGDVALLNCAPTYFSLLIVRGERLIFYRCKSANLGEEGAGPLPEGVLSRELATSFSYYQEKLAGQGIRTVYVRTVSRSFEDLRDLLERLGVGRAEAIDLSWAVRVPPGLRENALMAHRIAPAIGAAARGR